MSNPETKRRTSPRDIPFTPVGTADGYTVSSGGKLVDATRKTAPAPASEAPSGAEPASTTAGAASKPKAK